MYNPDELQPGDILLMTSGRRGLLSSLLDLAIAWSQANPLVHAAICADDAIIDPVWQVTRRARSFYRRTGWRMRVDCTPAQREAAVRWAQAHVGDPYGIAELLEDGVRFDLHFVARAWFRLHATRHTCAGFVAAAYASAGVVLTRAPLPAPSDLAFSPVLRGPRPWDAPPAATLPARGPSGARRKAS